MVHEDMYVTVNSARWNKNVEIYGLLIDAVAGAANRAAWPESSCFDFNLPDEKHNMKAYSFCNTVDHIAVAFPGGYSMDVTLHSSSPSSDRAKTFDCEKKI